MAVYEPFPIDIKYHSEYGNVPATKGTTSLYDLQAEDLPVLEADGMIFVGWYLTPNFEEGTKAEVGYVPGNDITLYAKWLDSNTVYYKMTTLADEIRVLSGGTEKIGLDDMAEDVGEANGEVVVQADVLEQIVAAVSGKSVPSELCTLTLKGDGKFRYLVYEDLDGVHVVNSIANSALPYTVNVKKGSMVCFNSEYLGGYSSGGDYSSMAKQHLEYALYTGPSYSYDTYFVYVYTIYDDFTFTASENLM